MTRIAGVDPTTATGRSAELLGAIKAKLGTVPNLYRVVAHSPAVLEATLSSGETLNGGVLTARQREAIAIATAEANGCDYCLSAHVLLGRGAGLSEPQIAAARHGESGDATFDAIIAFTRALLEKKGHVSDGEIAALRAAGLGDAALVEIVAQVTRNIFTNYLNHVARTEIDFPVVRTAA